MGRYPMITQSMTKEDFQLLLPVWDAIFPHPGICPNSHVRFPWERWVR